MFVHEKNNSYLSGRIRSFLVAFLFFLIAIFMLSTSSITVFAGSEATVGDDNGTKWVDASGWSYFNIYTQADPGQVTNERYGGKYWVKQDDIRVSYQMLYSSGRQIRYGYKWLRGDSLWVHTPDRWDYGYPVHVVPQIYGYSGYGWQYMYTDKVEPVLLNSYYNATGHTYHDAAPYDSTHGIVSGADGAWTIANRQYVIYSKWYHNYIGYEVYGCKVTYGAMSDIHRTSKYGFEYVIDTNDTGQTDWNETYGKCHAEVNIYLQSADNTLTFNTNNPNSEAITVASGSTASITTKTGETWGSGGRAFPVLSKTGYTFGGWFTKNANGTLGTQVTANTINRGDITVYAKWTPNVYTLTYNTNNPSSDNDISLNKSSQTAYYDRQWGTLATVSKPGYTFNGWYTAASGGSAISASTVCKGNLTVYAHWTVNRYTLTYNTNNPNGVNDISLSKASQTVNYNTAWGALATTSKTGYTFLGWFTSPTGGTQLSASTICKGNLTAYAHWSANTYTLTYDPNHPNDAATDSSDMTVSKTSQTTKFDQKWGTLATASKPGCQFLGWYTAKTGGTQVTANTICKGNLTVYGHWKVIIYTLTYDVNNPSPVSDASNIQLSKPNNQVKYSQAWGELATASKRGYTFLGWFTARSGGSEILATDVHNADQIAYAHWEPKPYTMTYHKNNPPTARTDDSNIELSKESQTVLFDQPWGELATAEKRGYTFLGWFTAPTGGTQITKDTLVDDNIDVYAHWTPIIYTLTYDKNNPPTARTDDSNINLSKTSQTAAFDSTWGPMATASKTGYTFLGWFTEPTDGEQVTKDSVVDGNLTVYAHWRVNQYIIRFHPNTENAGDTPIVTGDMPSITVEYDEARNLPENTFAKTTLIPAEDEGGETLRLTSVFKGWSTNKAALTPALSDEAPVLNWSSTDGDVIDLYAIWDDAPKFNVVDYPDRYFTLEEAQNGTITEDELLKTVKVYDRETNPLPPKPSGTPGPGVSIVGYDPNEFTDLTDDSSILVRYKVEDDSGNKAYLNIIVYVSRNANFDTSKTPYLRSISDLYADKDASLGGLSDGSQWRVDSTYAESLNRAMTSNVTIYDIRLDKAQLKKVREYIDTNGLGNSENPNALREFRNYVNY